MVKTTSILPKHKLLLVKKSKFSLIVESGYEICGTARSISYELNHITGKKFML